jgi:nucleoside-diphosphate-sugar epimerase
MHEPGRRYNLKVLVIGGTRFIGAAAVAELSSMGHEVTVYHRGQTENSSQSDASHIHGARDELGKHLDEFKRIAPDVVLDTRLTSEAEARQAVKVVKEFSSRLVALSSVDVYFSFGLINGTEKGPPQDIPINESGKLRSNLYPYRNLIPDAWAQGYDKILVERSIMGDDEVQGTALRLPMVYGPLDYQHRFFSWIKPMVLDKRSRILLGDGKASERGPTGYVENVAHGIALAVVSDAAKNQVFNVCDETALSTLELGRATARALDWAGKIVTAPDDKVPKNLRGSGVDWSVDPAKIRRELGFREVVSFEDGIKRTLKWEIENPPASPEKFQLVDYSIEDELLQELSL